MDLQPAIDRAAEITRTAQVAQEQGCLPRDRQDWEQVERQALGIHRLLSRIARRARGQ